MSKKLIFLLFGLLFLSSIFLVSGVSNPLEQQADDLEKRVDNIENFLDSDTKDKVARDYLREEWGKLFASEDFLQRHPYFRPLVVFYTGYKIAEPYTDPLFKFFIGIVPSLSWIFILILIIWYLIINFTILVYEALRDYRFFSKRGTLMIYFAFLLILFLLKIPQMISIWLAGLIVTVIVTIVDSWWLQGFLIALVMFIFGLLNKVKSQVGKYLKGVRQTNSKKDVVKASEEAKGATNFLKDLAEVEGNGEKSIYKK